MKFTAATIAALGLISTVFAAPAPVEETHNWAQEIPADVETLDTRAEKVTLRFHTGPTSYVRSDTRDNVATPIENDPRIVNRIEYLSADKNVVCHFEFKAAKQPFVKFVRPGLIDVGPPAPLKQFACV